MFAFYENRVQPFDIIFIENLTFISHLHRHLELLYVEEGEIELRIGDCQYLLHNGDTGLIFPHRIHSYQSGRDLKAILVIFDTDMVPTHKTVLAQCLPKTPVVPKNLLHPDIPYMLARIREEPAMGRKLLEGYLTVIFSRMIPRLGLEKSGPAENLSLPQRMLTYLGNHFTEPLSLSSAAQALGVSKYHLSRCFSQKIGCGFRFYLNTLRAQRAHALLAETELSLAEICFEAGFESVSTFYRAYQTLYGETPGGRTPPIFRPDPARQSPNFKNIPKRD